MRRLLGYLRMKTLVDGPGFRSNKERDGMRRAVLLIVVVAMAVLLAVGAALAAPPDQDAADTPSFGDEGGKEADTDQIIVKLENGASSEALEAVNRRNGASVKKEIPRTRLKVVKLPPGLSAREAARRYEALDSVEYAEPDHLVYPKQSTPTDAYYANGSLWGLNNTGQNSGTADADIDAPEAWSVATGSAGTVVAIIDTGVDINHPDLKNNIWTNPNETAGNRRDDDGNGYVDDTRGWDCQGNNNTVYDSSNHDKHGTHVAGTIAAPANGQGVVGVAPGVKVMPLKFMGQAGGYTSDAVECLNYAVNNRIKISNNSWGGGSFNKTLSDALDRANAAGHLFVAAASNEGTDNDASPVYPASYTQENVVAVAATDRNDAMASFSNYGTTSVDLAAPGAGIYSTLPKGTYGSYSGTSMATPHVSGAAALIKSKDSTLDDAGIKTRLLDSVDKKPNLAGKMVSEGRLNAARALETASP